MRRIRIRIRRTILLATVATLAIAPTALAAQTPTLDDSGSATTTLVGGAYRFDAGIVINCPAANTAGCTVGTTVSALVHPATGTASVMPVASSVTKVAAGTSGRVAARINMIGTRELKLRGSLRGQVEIEASAIGDAAAMTSARFAGEQKIVIPPLVLGEQAGSRSIKLAPGQRLQLRLDGENSSTGYAWKLDKLASSAALKLISSTSAKDPSCAAGTVGCFEIRSYVFAPVKAGRTMVSTGLYGPTPETDATVRIDLNVTTAALPPAVKTATIVDNGTTVRLLPGQDLVVQLDGESGSTGFAWRPMKALPMSAPITLAASTVVEVTCVPLVPGCPSSREMTYVVRRAGTTILELGLFGPASTVPSKRLRFAVVSR